MSPRVRTEAIYGDTDVAGDLEWQPDRQDWTTFVDDVDMSHESFVGAAVFAVDPFVDATLFAVEPCVDATLFAVDPEARRMPSRTWPMRRFDR